MTFNGAGRTIRRIALGFVLWGLGGLVFGRVTIPGTPMFMEAGELVRDAVFADGRFLLVTEVIDGAARFYTSADGQDWQAWGQPPETGTVDALFWIDGVLYATGYNTTTGHFILKSADGVDWTTDIVAPHPAAAEVAIGAPNRYVVFDTSFGALAGIFQNTHEGVLTDTGESVFYIPAKGSEIPAGWTILQKLKFNRDARFEVPWMTDIVYNSLYEGSVVAFGAMFDADRLAEPMTLEVFDENNELVEQTITYDANPAFAWAYREHHLRRRGQDPSLILPEPVHPDRFPGKSFFSFYRHELMRIDGDWVLRAEPDVSIYPYPGLEIDPTRHLCTKVFVRSENGAWALAKNGVDTWKDPGRAIWEERNWITHRSLHVRSDSTGPDTVVWSWTREDSGYHDDLGGAFYETHPPFEQLLEYRYFADGERYYRELVGSAVVESSDDGATWHFYARLPPTKTVRKIVSGNGYTILLTRDWINDRFVDEVLPLLEEDPSIIVPGSHQEVFFSSTDPGFFVSEHVFAFVAQDLSERFLLDLMPAGAPVASSEGGSGDLWQLLTGAGEPIGAPMVDLRRAQERADLSWTNELFFLSENSALPPITSFDVLSFEAGRLRLRIETLAGARYELKRSDGLDAVGWSKEGSPALGLGFPQTFSFPVTLGDATAAFFQVEAINAAAD